MFKPTALKIAGAALAVCAAFLVYRSAVAPQGEAAKAAAQASVSKAPAEVMNEPGKAAAAAYPADRARPEYVVTPPEAEITPRTEGVTEVKAGTAAFLVQGKDIYALTGGESGKWEKIAAFPVPDGSLFKKYRPKTEMWYYETEVGPAAGAPGGIWAGYKFYSGEGFNGIGGAAFYDAAARGFGVLRHPALVDCSVGALLAGGERLAARTYKQGEGYSSVCNGVVEIDLKTLKAVSYLPKESAVITDHDPAPGSVLLGDKYGAALEKVLSGEAGFEKKDAPNWSDAEREKILAEGLYRYMARTAREEAEAGAAAAAARPRDMRSDHMWIDRSDEARAAIAQVPPAGGGADIDEKEVRGVFAGLAAPEFAKVYAGLTDITSLRPDPLTLAGKAGRQKYYCICALAQDPAHMDYDGSLSFEENAKHSRVGCFVMTAAGPAKILKLADVATRRWRDYTGRCTAGENENEVVATFSGDTYGDQVAVRKYAVDPDVWTATLISETGSAGR